MKLTDHMDSGTVTTSNFISSIRNLGTDARERDTIKALLKNFLAPEQDMAIKDNQSVNNKTVYSVPLQPPASSYMNHRMKTINEAKHAFLKSTVSPTNINESKKDKTPKKDEVTLHYAQIAITTGSEDTRSTGGGDKVPLVNQIKQNKAPTSVDLVKKKLEQQQQQHRKVSFKIKNATTSHRRPPSGTKTMVITGNKVSELTKKFNNLVNESHNGTLKHPKAKEDLRLKRSSTVSPTPSLALSSSPNIKIVFRHRRGSKKRINRKRCWSVDSIDKLVLTDNSATKAQVIRSKSDGNKIPKTPKKRLKYQDSSSPSSDSVDGSPTKRNSDETKKDSIESQSIAVKNVIQKFEFEIIAQSNFNTLTRKTAAQTKNAANILKEKPKVPEKKCSLVVTKNLVVKDGVAKIKTIKPPVPDPPKLDRQNSTKISKEDSKKEPIYDKRKYKTSYIHSEKMPLQVVEIVPEDPIETIITLPNNTEQTLHTSVTILNTEEPTPPKTRSQSEENVYQEVNSRITPNESFLWRRKNSSTTYSDCEPLEGSYSLFNVTSLNESQTSLEDAFCDTSEKCENPESPDKETPEVTVNSDPNNSDFESNLVEAYNKEVMIGFTTLPKKELVVEDDYEPLEVFVPSVETLPPPVKKIDRTSKINCPLPEIPKETRKESPKSSKRHENVYQCLLEMRSHPEGDEASLHSYELYDSQIEERTRGDGDSDHGYEYCKSPIKPYCHTSSSGIHIAEDYQPNMKNTNKNYAISKSISGASTVSYEKIGSDRIYEKIPARHPPKGNSPSSCGNRHSIASSDYTSYNDGENIYDSIKHSDGTSLTHYESIPNSPSMVKLRNNFKKQLASAVQKRLSFDTVSNISQSTLSSEQKTNSIYGQRSVISYNGQEINFQVPSSETSTVSDRSDRSDEWIDVSDEEKTEEQKIVM